MYSAWFAVTVLIASLSLHVNSTPTSSTCMAMVETPVTLDREKMLGSWKLIKGLSHNLNHVAYLETLDSAWAKITASNYANKLVMMEYDRIDGTCSTQRAQIDIIDATTLEVIYNFDDKVGKILNTTSDDWTVFNFDYTEDCKAHPTLYLLARKEYTLKESDLQKFLQMAKCFDFSLPADFLHNTTQATFCPES